VVAVVDKLLVAWLVQVVQEEELVPEQEILI
jgi:hypothetical protein